MQKGVKNPLKQKAQEFRNSVVCQEKRQAVCYGQNAVCVKRCYQKAGTEARL